MDIVTLLVDLLSWALLLTGSFFCLVGSFGMLRMPDVFTRMHAAGVIDCMGVGGIVAGLVLQAGFTLVAAKLVIILLLVLITSPVATHALAQAALHDGIKPLLGAAARRRRAGGGGVSSKS